MPSAPTLFSPSFIFSPISFSDPGDEDKDEPREKIIAAGKTRRVLPGCVRSSSAREAAGFHRAGPTPPTSPPHHPLSKLLTGRFGISIARRGRDAPGWDGEGVPGSGDTVCTGKGSSTGRKGGFFWTRARSKHPGREQPSFAGGRGTAGSRRVGYAGARGGAGTLSPQITRRLYQHGWPGPPGNAELQHWRPENRPRAKKRPNTSRAVHTGTRWRHPGSPSPQRLGSCAPVKTLQGALPGIGGGSFCAHWPCPHLAGGIFVLRQPGVLGAGSVFISLPITGGSFLQAKNTAKFTGKIHDKASKGCGQSFLPPATAGTGSWHGSTARTRRETPS